MKFNILIIIICLISLSCNEKATEVFSTNTLDSISMKIDTPKGTHFEFLSLPKTFIELTKTDTGFVIFNSCDAGNGKFKILSKKDKIILFHYGSQEDYYEVVKDVFINSRGIINFNTLLTDENYINETLSGSAKNELNWVDSTNGIIKLNSVYKNNNSNTRYFIDSLKSKKIKIIDQPCEECWDKETCDEWRKDKRIDN